MSDEKRSENSNASVQDTPVPHEDLIQQYTKWADNMTSQMVESFTPPKQRETPKVQIVEYLRPAEEKRLRNPKTQKTSKGLTGGFMGRRGTKANGMTIQSESPFNADNEGFGPEPVEVFNNITNPNTDDKTDDKDIDRLKLRREPTPIDNISTRKRIGDTLYNITTFMDEHVYATRLFFGTALGLGTLLMIRNSRGWRRVTGLTLPQPGTQRYQKVFPYTRLSGYVSEVDTATGTFQFVHMPVLRSIPYLVNTALKRTPVVTPIQDTIPMRLAGLRLPDDYEAAQLFRDTLLKKRVRIQLLQRKPHLHTPNDPVKPTDPVDVLIKHSWKFKSGNHFGDLGAYLAKQGAVTTHSTINNPVPIVDVFSTTYRSHLEDLAKKEASAKSGRRGIYRNEPPSQLEQVVGGVWGTITWVIQVITGKKKL